MLLLLFSCSVVSDAFVTQWAVAHQAPLSVGFLRQNFGVCFQFLLQEIFPTPGIELKSPALAGGFFTTEPPGKSIRCYYDPHFTDKETEGSGHLVRSL